MTAALGWRGARLPKPRRRRRLIPGQQVRKEVYDAIIDDVVEREFTTLDRQVRNFWIAVSAKEGGEAVTRCRRYDDGKGLSKLVGTGDRVRVKGYFKFRRYEKDGVTKTARTFVVEDLKVERLQGPSQRRVANH